MTLIYARDASGNPTAEWLSVRRGKITGSGMHRLMGTPKARLTYLIEKLAERLSGNVVGVGYVSAAMQHGIDKEDEARREYEMVYGVGLIAGYWIWSAEHGFGATPDYLTHDGQLVEIKCLQPKTTIREMFGNILAGKDEPSDPLDEYWWQCQAQMAATGAQWADLAYYTPDMPQYTLWVRRIERDDHAIEHMLRAVEQANSLLEQVTAENGWWWEAYVRDRVLPAIEAAASADEVSKAVSSLRTLPPPDVAQIIDEAVADRVSRLFGA